VNDWKPTLPPEQDRRRWGNWLFGLAFALACLAAYNDNDGHSRWWPPVLATAFAVAFVAQIVDAYRTGVAWGRFGRADRYPNPSRFNIDVGVYIVLALFTGFLAVTMWIALALDAR
jgi:hypothetical protein